MISGFDAGIERVRKRIKALENYIVVDCEYESLYHNPQLRKMVHPVHGKKKIISGKMVLSEISIGFVLNRRRSHILRYVVAPHYTPKSETLYGIDFETDTKTLKRILPPMVKGWPMVAYDNSSEVRTFGHLGCNYGEAIDLTHAFKRVSDEGVTNNPKLKHLVKHHGIVAEDDNASFHNSANDVYFQYELIRRIQDGTATHFF